MLYLLAFAIVFGLLYYVFSGRTPVKPLERALNSVRQYVPEIPPGPPAHHWRDEGRYASEVENDSIYQPAIARLADDHGPAMPMKSAWRCWCATMPTPSRTRLSPSLSTANWWANWRTTMRCACAATWAARTWWAC